MRAVERLLDRGLEAVREVEHEVGPLDAGHVLRRQLDVVRLGARRRQVRDRDAVAADPLAPRRRADRSRRRRASRPSSPEAPQPAASDASTTPAAIARMILIYARDDNGSHHALSRTVIIERVTSWTDEAHSRLQGSGQRMGAARAAVIEYLDEQQCCRGAQEIHEALAARGSTVGPRERLPRGRRPRRAGPAPARRLRRRHRPLRAACAPATTTTITSSARAAARSRRSTTPRSSARSRRSSSRPATTSSRTTSCCAAPAPTASREGLSPDGGSTGHVHRRHGLEGRVPVSDTSNRTVTDHPQAPEPPVHAVVRGPFGPCPGVRHV